jgi:hypothetical protein
MKTVGVDMGLASGRTAKDLSLDLVFPEGEPVRRLPPQVSLAEMSKRCEELRVMFPDGLPRPEERWAAKTDVPFRLK